MPEFNEAESTGLNVQKLIKEIGNDPQAGAQAEFWDNVAKCLYNLNRKMDSCPAGGGDMLKSVYDPTNKSADAFSMGQMAETAAAKIMTAAERLKLLAVDSEIGNLSWNTDYYTFDVDSTLGPVLQIGQEQYLLVYNDTGAQINNGKILRPKAAFLVGSEVIPTFQYAQADTHDRAEGTIAVSTMNIPIAGVGLVTRFGKVRGVNTNGLTPGADLYLSESSLGDFTTTRPAFPNYEIKIGGVIVPDPIDGEIFVSITTKVSDTFINFFTGICREAFDFRITSDGATVTGSLEPNGSPTDLTLVFSTGLYTFDTSPAATVVLTAGSDTSPQLNYVFIPESTKVLTVSTSSWPAAEHVKIAICQIQSATGVQTLGAYRNQNINDELMSEGGNGHVTHLGERIRLLESQWLSGVAGSLSGAPTNGYFSVTSGKVFQMHEQTFPALDMSTGDEALIVNDSVTAYDPITDLVGYLDLDALGNSLNNRWFSLVLWGVINKTGEVSHLMINLPTGSYSGESSAQGDISDYSVYSIPQAFRGVGFLIGRFTLQLASGGGSIVYNGGDSYQDLRGFIPNTTAGGGTGGSGVTEWTQLNDTPNSYTGKAGFYPKVAATENALEFPTGPNKQTGTTYTFALSDGGDKVEANNAAAIVHTIPLNASVAFPVGIDFADVQTGAGLLTIRGAVGVTINGNLEAGGGESDVVSQGQWKGLSIYQDSADSWRVLGGV